MMLLLLLLMIMVMPTNDKEPTWRLTFVSRLYYDGVVVVVVVRGDGNVGGDGDNCGGDDNGEPTWRLSPASQHLLGLEAQNLDLGPDPTPPGGDD